MSESTSEPPPPPARDRWGTKAGFILAAIGSAIGIGNIWRYPYVVYDNGGGAFLIPYFVALATAGLPILMVEYALGHKFRRAAPFSFRAIARRWEWLGWGMAGVSFVIATYYIVILGWCLAFVFYSTTTEWGQDTEGFFLGDFLNVADDFWSTGSVQLEVLIPLLLAWAFVYALLRRGVVRGIELVARVLIPVLVVMLAVIVVRGLTLDGAGTGLNALLAPDFSALDEPSVWVAAFGQVFFSLSVGFSIMIAYTSYLPRKTDLTNSSLIVGLSNASFEFFAALGVFAALGFLAVSQNVAVAEVSTSGVGLAFVVFPQILNEMPGPSELYGVLFFGALFFAGITSMVSILECVIAAVREKFDLTRAAAVNWICGLCALVSLLYVTRGGLFYLDTVDHFINNYGLVVVGLVEVVLLAWVVRQLGTLREHLNDVSYVKLGRWWTIVLTVITPVLIGYVTIYSAIQEFDEAYEGYPTSGLLVLGLGVVVLTFALAVVLSLVRRHASQALDGDGGEG